MTLNDLMLNRNSGYLCLVLCLRVIGGIPSISSNEYSSFPVSLLM